MPGAPAGGVLTENGEFESEQNHCAAYNSSSFAFKVAVVTGLGMKPSKKPPPSAELISVSSAFAELPTITVRFLFAAASQALYLRVHVTPSMMGMRKSMMQTSYELLVSMSRPCSPFPASSTRNPALSRIL